MCMLQKSMMASNFQRSLQDKTISEWWYTCIYLMLFFIPYTYIMNIILGLFNKRLSSLKCINKSYFILKVPASLSKHCLFNFIFYLFIFKILFIYLWLHWVFVAAHRLSLVAVSRGCSVAVYRLLIAVASLLAEHGL